MISQVSIQELNSLFSFLSQQINSTFWIRSLDYKRQLYVSAAFEKIWGLSCEMLYEHPESWYDTLVKDDNAAVITHLSKRINNQHVDDTVLFRIHHSSGEQRFIRDRCFLLVDNAGNIVGRAGMGEQISEQEWEHQKTNSNITALNALEGISLDTILKKELNLKAAFESSTPTLKAVKDKQGNLLDLHKREIQCLYYLFEGKSAKQTAALLFVSSRTVEYYLDIVKKRFKSRSKLELMSKIDYISLQSCMHLLSHENK